MFNGIVEMVGIITNVHITEDSQELTITPENMLSDIIIGDSIAINGVCLTITKINPESFVVKVVPETLRRTNLKSLHQGKSVNLERSLPVNGRISGHFVQGHIDTTAKILEISPDGNEAITVKIEMPATYAKYIVNKGYIAIDGMSITIIEANSDWFNITLIPHTQMVTVAKHYREGDLLNLEVDILGKYIEKLMAERV